MGKTYTIGVFFTVDYTSDIPTHSETTKTMEMATFYDNIGNKLVFPFLVEIVLALELNPAFINLLIRGLRQGELK